MTSATLSLSGGMVTVDPLGFLLICDASGGLPTRHFWARNNGLISDFEKALIISISASQPWQSTLEVIGHLPGIYRCYPTNRATHPTIESNIIKIEGV